MEVIVNVRRSTKEDKRKKESRTSGINRKYLVDFNSNLSVITSNANAPIKRQIQNCQFRSKD